MGKRIALVLGSGGARGYTHIGVIDEVRSRGYEIAAISGCSMGALVGGIYAAGQLEGYRDWVCRLDYFDVLKLVDVTWSPMGAMRASKVMNKLESLIGDIRIEDLSIPLTTVATDLTRQKEIWFQSGPLLRAIRASIAVPGIITPVHLDGQILVDGGLLNPLPIIPTVAVHADLVVAVNSTAQTSRQITLEELLPPEEAAQEVARERERESRGQGFGGWLGGVRQRVQHMFGNGTDEGDVSELTEQAAAERAWSKLDMMLASFDITQAALAKYKVAGYPPDILIEVPKSVCGAYEFHRAEALIQLGRHLAAQAIDRYEGDRDMTVAEGDVPDARRYPVMSGRNTPSSR
ncbi:patatin-like phospholipase family protein [Chromohalobacter israelensis]|uniref:patatin-like phospholipase family protein n=1 Tax=Chromohalobacter israelensis TaxID=141390 RepID=UPI000D71219A|nr:patatin-like phospholipase family protein [Chromohalobacter salexigens]PWW37759.1 NTE family protein [Chromohalobacter salexigens]